MEFPPFEENATVNHSMHDAAAYARMPVCMINHGSPLRRPWRHMGRHVGGTNRRRVEGRPLLAPPRHQVANRTQQSVWHAASRHYGVLKLLQVWHDSDCLWHQQGWQLSLIHISEPTRR